MFSTLALRKGQDEYHLCWRLEDCQDAGDGTPAALSFYDQISALYFLRTFISDSGEAHDFRPWLLSRNSSFSMYAITDDDVLDYAAKLIASGQLIVAAMEGAAGEGKLEGILRPGGASQSILLSTIESTPLQDDMASRESASEVQEILADEPAPETTWIEIELLDADGEPVPNEPFKITFPDGSIKYGRLNGKAKARIEKLSPGTCKVTFPDRDEEVWDIG